MKVQIEQNVIQTARQAVEQPKAEASPSKGIHELSPGDRFKAAIVDIQPNQVSLRLESGQTLTAKSLVLPEARIGEESIFQVTENLKGQILLEMVKPGAQLAQGSVVMEALRNAGLYPSKDNIALVMAMVENNLPIDAQSLQKAAFFQYSKEGVSIESVLLLMEEQFPALENSVSTLEGIMDKTVHLADNLKFMISDLLRMEDTDARNRMLEILLPQSGSTDRHSASIKAGLSYESIKNVLDALMTTGGKEREDTLRSLTSEIHKHFVLELTDKDSLKELNQYYNKVNNTVTELLQAAEAAGQKGDFVQQLSLVKDNLSFMNHIGQYKEYMQIPFSVAGNENQAELIILKDGKKQKDYRKQASVLMSLDYAYMGHIEVFINKSMNQVSLQFKGDMDSARRLIEQNRTQLVAALQEKGYTVTGLSVKKLEEAFSITDRPREKRGEAPKRYAFDMRV